MAQVSIDVSAKLDQRDMRSVSERIHDAVMQTATTSGIGFGREFSRSARVDAGQIMPGAARFATKGAEDGRVYGKAFERAAKDPIAQAVDRIQGRRVRAEADTIAKGMLGITDAVQNTGSAFAHLGATGPVALGTIGIAAYNLTGAAISASQALWLLPGAFAAIGAGVLTAKIGLSGFMDALGDMRDAKKFAEDLQSLSPNAQQAALGIRAMLPVLDQLKAATQDALFNNVGPQLNQLANAYLPVIQQMTTTIATGFNSAFSGIANAMMDPQTMQTMQVTMQNIGQAFQNIAPAAPAIAQALTDIINVGSGFLPQIATQISNAATAFQEFIANARESGQLRQWLADGLNTISDLVDLGKAVVKVFWELKPTAEVALKGTTLLWQGLGGAIDLSKRSIDVFSTAFSGITTVVSAVGSAVMPILDNIRDAIDRMLAPVRTAIDWANKVPGVHIDQIPSISGNTPGYSGGSGPPPIPQGGPVGSGNGAHGGYADRRRAGMPNTAGGPLVPAIPQGGYAVPLPPPDGSSRGGGAAKSGAPTVPYSGDPMDLLQGYPVTSSLYSAAQSVKEAQQKVAQDAADLNKLQADNTATESDIQAAKNKLLKDQQDQQEAELRLNEAKQKFARSTKDATKTLEDITGNIDFSGGIPGLIKGLIQSVATLAAAPLLGQLQAIKQANPGEGSGLFGIAAANGLFGPQYTPGAINAASQGGYSPGYGYGGYGAYPGDAALLANVPSGRYSQTGNADLVKGLGDCSSAVEDLVNLLDGRPTSGRSMSTGNAAEWLTSRGFLPGMGGPGDFRVGYNGGHMQATLPNGTPFNWGSDSAAARGGVGGTGADDPAFTSHYYRPATTPMGSTVPHNIYSPANTDPALNNPVPQGGSQYAYGLAGPLPTSFPGGPLGSGMPTATPQYAPQVQPQAAPGWRPSGSNGGGGGLLGMAAAAASSGLNMLAPGAGALAQMGIQAINRTVQFGGEVASELAQGALSSLSISDPDSGGGTDLSTSWVGRLASSMASAAPAIPSSAGAMDKATQQGQQQANPQQSQQGNQQQPGQGGVHIENFVQSPDRQGVQQTANDLAYATYASGMR